MVLGDAIDAEDVERVPGEGDRVRSTSRQGLARLRRRHPDAGAAEHADEAPDGRLRWADVLASSSSGRTSLSFEGKCRASANDMQNLTSPISSGIGAIPRIERARAGFGVGEVERDLAMCNDREAPGLIAGIDVCDVCDAIARHVVVVGRGAQLLRGEDGNGEPAVGRFGDRLSPRHQSGRLQGMLRRHPVGDALLRARIRGHRQRDGARERDGPDARHRLPLDLFRLRAGGGNQLSIEAPALTTGRTGAGHHRFQFGTALSGLPSTLS